MPDGALSGIKVLDLSQGIAGGFCARLLGDYGAEVLKVEPPSGDVLRTFGPFYKDDPHPEKCLFFLILNVNKRGVTLNLETAAGRDLLRELARDADIVVESFKPGRLAKLGLAYEDLARVNPGLIMVSITPFGQDGPYSQFEGEELIQYAMGSVMSFSGTKDREPLKHGGFQSEMMAGLSAAGVTSLATYMRDLSGRGTHIDVSIVEVVASTLVNNQAYYTYTGSIQGRRDPKGTMFQNPMPCADGWIIAQPGGGAAWETVAEFFRAPQLLDPKFTTPQGRAANGEEMDAIIVDAIKDRKKFDLLAEAAERRMLFGVVQDAKDLADCPQLESRGFYQEVDHPVIGRTRIPAVLFNAPSAPYALRRPAPLLGQHNEEVYCGDLGRSKGELTHMRKLNVI